LKQHPHRYSLRYLSANLLMLPWKIKIAKWVKVFFFVSWLSIVLDW
jgi:hypothetical protein